MNETVETNVVLHFYKGYELESCGLPKIVYFGIAWGSMVVVRYHDDSWVGSQAYGRNRLLK